MTKLVDNTFRGLPGMLRNSDVLAIALTYSYVCSFVRSCVSMCVCVCVCVHAMRA